jgi:HPt (histidine-containing phosphotransfer) domain-containing protein
MSSDAELAALFASERDETIAALEALLGQAQTSGWQEAQRQEAIRYAHSLKGAAAAMGETPLSRLARLLEQTIKAVPVTAASPAADGSAPTSTRWRVAFVPTPPTLASQTLRDEVDRLAWQWGCSEPPVWDEAAQPPTWRAELTAPADGQRVLRQAFELFAVPGTLEIAPVVAAGVPGAAPSAVSAYPATLAAPPPILWQPPFLAATEASAREAIRWPAVLAYWQQCWQMARPQWSIHLTGDRGGVAAALVARLAEAFGQLAERLPATPPLPGVPLTLFLARKGALLTLTVTGDPAQLSPFVAALEPGWAAMRGTTLAARPGQWVGGIPWAPGQLWAFWLRVGEEQIAVAAEAVEAFYPAPSADGCRHLQGRWYVVEKEPLPWVSLPVAGALPTPAQYGLMLLLRVGDGRLLTGADGVDPAGLLTLTPMTGAQPAYWTAWAVARDRLAPVFEPTLWDYSGDSSFSAPCR